MRRRHKKNYILDNKPSDFIDTEYADKASLWILRILFPLYGHREFLDKDGFITKESILLFLGGAKFLDDGKESSESRKDLMSDFAQELEILESKTLKENLNSILTKNIKRISTLINLNNTEEAILEFIVLIKQYELLDDAVSLLGHELNTKQAKRALSIILGISQNKIEKALQSDSKLVSSSLITIDKHNTRSLDSKFDSISDVFIDNMANSDEDILTMVRDILRPCSMSDLKLKDYEHVKKDIKIILSHLKESIKKKKKGVNILLYGPAGTGKTELSKLLAKKLNSALYEVSYADEEDDSMDGNQRVRAYKSAQALLANERTILMYDEAEDIFESSGGSFLSAPSRQKDKAWINRMLESNSVPTIWITNNIHSIDDAIVRRFDYALELVIPKKAQRKKIIKKYSEDILDAKSLKLLSQHESIAPALISRATNVVKNIESKSSSKDFIRIVNNTLKAQGYGELKSKKKVKKEKLLPSIYKPEFINSDTDLQELSKGIKAHPNARICLYGAAGTGKSAYGRYIAKTLKKPLIIKKVSDLMDMYVGGTEKNIASAFAEAKKKKAVLVFDEVDSFLSERGNAQRSWEVSQVNEMLVQMENFEGIFIATTNLMENLDKASLRRFDMKLKFDFLKPTQAWEMFMVFHKELGLKESSKSLESDVRGVHSLTPGDFAVVVRQSKFRSINNSEEFLERLREEVAVKDVDEGNVMGFLQC